MSISPALVSLFSGLHQSAIGQTNSQEIFIQYNISNGLTRDCVRRGKGENGKIIAGPMFKPLEKYLANLSVVDTLKNENGKYQHGNGEAAWTCAGNFSGVKAAGNGLDFHGPSLDWRIAQALSADPTQISAVLGMPYKMGGGNCGQKKSISASGNRRMISPEFDIYKAWAKHFDISTSINRSPERLMKVSLINKVMEDTRRQIKLLPMHERIKADQYLDSLNNLEKSLTSSSSTTCQTIDEPNGLTPRKGQVDIAKRKAEHLPAYWQAVVDMAASLISCGIKQQITLLHSMGCAHMRYDSGRGNGTMLDHHWHDSKPGFIGGETGKDMDRILAMHTGYINSILDKLAETPGSNQGEMLIDHTKLMMGSDGGGRHHKGYDKYCILLFGGSRTNLVKGRYIDGKGRPLADFLLTLLQSFDSSAESFGDGLNGGQNTLNEILLG